VQGNLAQMRRLTRIRDAFMCCQGAAATLSGAFAGKYSMRDLPGTHRPTGACAPVKPGQPFTG
jgi:hypothetical protein